MTGNSEDTQPYNLAPDARSLRVIVHALVGDDFPASDEDRVVRAAQLQFSRRVEAKQSMLAARGPVCSAEMREIRADTFGELQTELLAARDYLRARASLDPPIRAPRLSG